MRKASEKIGSIYINSSISIEIKCNCCLLLFKFISQPKLRATNGCCSASSCILLRPTPFSTECSILHCPLISSIFSYWVSKHFIRKILPCFLDHVKYHKGNINKIFYSMGKYFNNFYATNLLIFFNLHCKSMGTWTWPYTTIIDT